MECADGEDGSACAGRTAFRMRDGVRVVSDAYQFDDGQDGGRRKGEGA